MKFGASFSLSRLQIADLVFVKKIGLDFIELSINQFWDDLEELELQLIAISEVVDSYDLFSIIHLPHLNSQFIKDVDIWTNFIDRMSEQITICSRLAFTKKMIFHGVFGRTENPDKISKEQINEMKDQAINEWLNIARKNKLDLLIENTDETIQDLERVFNNHKDLGFVFDIAHANILFPNSPNQNLENRTTFFLESFRDRLRHIHLSDNFGGTNESADLHLPIGVGSINFIHLFQKLAEIKYKDTVTFEIHSPKYQTLYLDTSLQVVKNILVEISDDG